MNKMKKELYDLVASDPKIFDFIQEAALDGMWYWNLENTEEGWISDKFWEVLGFNPSNCPQTFEEWTALIHPDDFVISTEKFNKHLVDAQYSVNQLVRYTHKNGSRIWIKVKGMAIRNEEGKPIRILGVHVNMTDEKKMDELLKDTNRVARVGAWEMNIEKGELYWSTILREMLEFPQNYIETLEESINLYKKGRSREIITKAYDEAVKLGKPFDEELEIITASGKEIWVRVIGYSEMYEGRCIRIYGVFQDIDKQKRAEENLRQISILEAKSKEMEQFAFVASHDLREPLLTIRGYSDLLKDEYAKKLDEDGREMLDAIGRAIDRMDDLIHGLLGYSRLSQVKDMERLAVEEILQNVQEDLMAVIEANQAEIRVEKMPIIHAYAVEMKMLFQNLLSNALKFKKDGVRPKILITSEKIEKGWKFLVKDNGIGIDEKNSTKIFNLFTRLHDNTQYTGTGIGLANCKKIVEMHHGNIWIEANPEGGSSFYFTILTEE